MGAAAVDPMVASNFQLDITGMTSLLVTSVQLPSRKLTLNKGWTMTSPKDMAPTRTVTLFRPGGLCTFSGVLSADKTLELWIKATLEQGTTGSGKANVKAATLMLFDTDGAPTGSWKLDGCVIKSIAYSTVELGLEAHMTYTAQMDVDIIERLK